MRRSTVVTNENDAAPQRGKAAAVVVAPAGRRGLRDVSNNLGLSGMRAVPAKAANARVVPALQHPIHPAEPEPMALETPAPPAPLPVAAAPAPGFHDIDLLDADDPQICREYANDVHDTLKLTEGLRRPSVDYMNMQHDINPSMRSILMDWLIEVSEEYKLGQESLYLTVGFVDRFLSLIPVNRSRLQLVGITAMLIASKFDEIYAPTVDDFVYITDNTYPRDEVLQMETIMLQTLNFELMSATAMQFLLRYCKAADLDPRGCSLAMYYTEWTLLDLTMLAFLPSHIAACCVALARQTDGRPCWTPVLGQYSQLSPAELRPCMREVCRIVGDIPTSPYLAVKEKYTRSKHCKVAVGVLWRGGDPVPFA